MGNAALRELATLSEHDIEEFEGATVAVDAYNWLYKYMTTISRFTADEAYTTDDGRTIPTLIGVPRGLTRFFENDLTPLFVFDGDPHERKADEIAARRNAKEKAAEKAEEARKQGDAIAAASYEARTQRLDDDVVETTKDILNLLDVPYCDAAGAAEAQAAYFAQEGLVEYVISDDYDAMLFGSPKTLRNFTSSSKPLECLNLESTISDRNLTREQLVDVAILCGTDYNEGVHGVGVKTATKGIESHGTLKAFLEENDTTINEANAIREIFLNPRVSTEEPPLWTMEPDVNGVRAYLANLGIDISQVDSTLNRIEDNSVQTGLDKWA